MRSNDHLRGLVYKCNVSGQAVTKLFSTQRTLYLSAPLYTGSSYCYLPFCYQAAKLLPNRSFLIRLYFLYLPKQHFIFLHNMHYIQGPTEHCGCSGIDNHLLLFQTNILHIFGCSEVLASLRRHFHIPLLLVKHPLWKLGLTNSSNSQKPLLSIKVQTLHLTMSKSTSVSHIFFFYLQS